MRYINHKSDFQVIINIKDKEGNIVAPPSVPWEAVFSDENGVEFKCSYDGTNYTHCIVDFSDIVCFIDNPGFACGKLRCTFHQHVPSAEYCDGVMDLTQPLQCDIMLSKRESDDSTPITIEASPNWVRGPQGPKGDKGEQGPQGPQGEQGPQETKESIEEKLGAWFEEDGGEVDGEVYTKAESDARYLRGDWELIGEVSEYDKSKNVIIVAENCDGYKELAVRRTNINNINNTNVYLQIGVADVSLQNLSSNTKDAVWHIVQDGNNVSVKFLTYNLVNTGGRLTYPTSRHEYCINCKIGGKVKLNFYTLTTLHDGENIKVYGKR